jgi:hypothetical protein
MSPLVSVLTPTWNRAGFLATAIESVLAQQMDDLELIIGDNASTDETPELVRRYAARDARVKYFRNPFNLGATPNLNRCYRHSDPSSRYWVMLASDDWWDVRFLAKMVAAAEANPTATLIHSDAYRTDAAGSVIGRYSEMWSHLPPAGLHRALRELLEGNYVCAPAAMFNRAQQVQVCPREAPFNPGLNLTVDYELYLQLLSRGAYGCYVPEPLLYFRKHEGAMTMPINTVPRLREEIQILQDLAAVCEPELEPARAEAVRVRSAKLGFELLGRDQAEAARTALAQAERGGARRRLDLTVARLICMLPLPQRQRGGLWRMALTTSLVVKGAR